MQSKVFPDVVVTPSGDLLRPSTEDGVHRFGTKE